MVKGIFVALLSFLVLCACSSQPQKAASLVEAIGSEGISIFELQKITDSSILDGIKKLTETKYGEKLQKTFNLIS
jgi:hypothetical protein